MFINGLFQNYNFPKLYRGSEGPTFPWGSQMLISIETQRSSDFFFFFGGGGGGGHFIASAFKNTFEFGFLLFNAGKDHFCLFSHKINVHLILLQSVNCEKLAVAGIFSHFAVTRRFTHKTFPLPLVVSPLFSTLVVSHPITKILTELWRFWT